MSYQIVACRMENFPIKQENMAHEEEIHRDVQLTVERLILEVKANDSPSPVSIEKQEEPPFEKILEGEVVSGSDMKLVDCLKELTDEKGGEITEIISKEDPEVARAECVLEETTVSPKLEPDVAIELVSELVVVKKESQEVLKLVPELDDSKKAVCCHRCKASSSWFWKKITAGGFLCSSCDNRDGRLEGEEQPPLKRAHRDSVVLADSDSLELDSKSAELAKIESDIDGVVGGDASGATPQPTRKSSRSTRNTLSNTNPYAYPRPVVSKPKEKKSIIRNAPSYSSPNPVLKLAPLVRYKGTYIRMGDIVSVRGHDGGIYFAQIRGLLEDQYCEKSAALTWLLPTRDSPPPERGFDPETYIIGMEEDVPRSLDTMEFVMHAPSDFFKLQLPHGFEETYGLYDNLKSLT